MATMLKNFKLLYLRNRLSYRDEILHGDAQYHSCLLYTSDAADE